MINTSRKLGLSPRQLTRLAARHAGATELLGEIENLLANGGEPDGALESVGGARPRMLRMRQVLALVALSRSTVHRLIAAGEFPSGRLLTARTRAWTLAEVEAWISQRSGEVEP